VVLDSAYPPGTGSYGDAVASGATAIAALSGACAAEPACHDRVEDVQRDIRSVVRTLDDRPFTFTDDAGHRMVITGDDVVSGLFVTLYDSALIPLLPDAIHALARENYALIPALAATAVPFMNDVSEGAYLSYECADNARLSTDADRAGWRARPGAGTLLLLAGWYLMCDVWDVAPTPPGFDRPVTSDIPTLVVAGEFDPITPASGSEALADSLGRALFVEVPRGGHTPGVASSCVREVIASFVDRPDRTDRSCVDGQEPVPFGI
jgi:pimeloyl-ACP methyl ester carboxylesterase